MNGIEKLTERIASDARAEAEAILADARTQAQTIARQWEERARKERADILAQGEKRAAERLERLDSMAHMEGRRTLLGEKQALLEEAFDQALERLLALPEEEYVELLARLCAKAADTGREELIFSPQDRARVGKKVAARANELLARDVSPQLPQEWRESTAGAILDRVVTAGSALLAGTGMLTVSEETRPIRGGVILRAEGVEVNCAFDTLARLARPRLEREAAQRLFGA